QRRLRPVPVPSGQEAQYPEPTPSLPYDIGPMPCSGCPSETALTTVSAAAAQDAAVIPMGSQQCPVGLTIHRTIATIWTAQGRDWHQATRVQLDAGFGNLGKHIIEVAPQAIAGQPAFMLTYLGASTSFTTVLAHIGDTWRLIPFAEPDGSTPTLENEVGIGAGG